MQDLVDELKKVVPFQETTGPGDIVLIAGENPRMIVYGMVVSIEPDSSRRDQWWHVTMHILSVPPRQVTWTLREPQFTGREIFTMAGDARFVQAVSLKNVPGDPATGEPSVSPAPGGAIRRVK